jgi:hypothetical protein
VVHEGVSREHLLGRALHRIGVRTAPCIRSPLPLEADQERGEICRPLDGLGIGAERVGRKEHTRADAGELRDFQELAYRNLSSSGSITVLLRIPDRQ